MVMRDVARVHATGEGADDMKTLGYAKTQAGDFLDVAVVEGEGRL